MSDGLIFALFAAGLAIAYGIIFTTRILKLPSGNEAMQKIAAAIQAGAEAYLKRQYLTISIVGVVLAIVLLLALDTETSLGFVIGAVFSCQVV